MHDTVVLGKCAGIGWVGEVYKIVFDHDALDFFTDGCQPIPSGKTSPLVGGIMFRRWKLNTEIVGFKQDTAVAGLSCPSLLGAVDHIDHIYGLTIEYRWLHRTRSSNSYETVR